MILSYKLKLYLNEGKKRKLNALLSLYRDKVNNQINNLWPLGKKVLKMKYPEYVRGGGRLGRDAAGKALAIVKGAMETKSNKPVFKGFEVDMNEAGIRLLDFTTKNFDLWFFCQTLEKRRRILIPAKQTACFVAAYQKGKLKKSFRIQRIWNDYYIVCFVEMPEVKKDIKQAVGIDMGLTNPVTVSDGRVFGKELTAIQRKTKHRIYKKGLSAVKQQVNHVAKELINAYPETNFVFEDLNFKGKHGMSKRFRRNNKNWCYKHLKNRLEQIAPLKGFQVTSVDPRNTSRTCSVCGYTDGWNRRGSDFSCVFCSASMAADHNAAINILRKSTRELSSPNKLFSGKGG